MTGTVNITSSTITGQTTTGGTASQKTLGPIQISAANPVIAIQDVSFSGAGNVTITPPEFATAVLVTPPSNNATALSIAGTSGATNPVPISPNQCTFLTFSNPAGQSANVTFIAAGAVTGVIEWSFV